MPGTRRGPAKAWTCTHCGARNVTASDDVFKEQCRTCTRYNEVDWSDESDVTLPEAANAVGTETS